MRISPASVTAILAGTAALAFAGCGDDGGGSTADDEQGIQAVATKAITTTDAEVKCVDVVTEGFVKMVYGSLEQCKKAEAPDPDDDPKPTGARMSSIKIDGDKATGIVTVEGGDSAGASGELSFEKVDGDWKVSDLGISFLRSQLTTSVTNSPFSESGDEPLDDAKARTCIVKAFAALPDDQFRTIAFKAISDQDPDPTFLKIFTDCTQGSTDDSSSSSSDDDGEQSLLRTQFEKGIREAAKKDGATDAQVDCVVKELRRTITEDQIVEEIGRGGDSVTPDLAKKTAQAIQKCG
ncbi:hypothetical protein [Paraconexibacter sp.]|uniref:hypothetical protein n=1 Tax=Paraconexibacter sp. TaxID=2949640 RepID=UPI003563EDCA